MEKIDVLYIHPSKFMKKPTYCLFPIGVVGLLNLLKDNGYKVEAVNYPVEIGVDKNFDIRKYLAKRQVSIVLIDMFFYEHILGAIHLARICKEIKSDAKVIVGGFTATYFAKEILQNIKEIDFVIKGEAEEPLLELVREILKGECKFSSIPNLCYREDGRYIENGWEYETDEDTLNSLNFTNLDFFRHSDLQFQINTLESFHSISLKSPPSFVIYLGRGCIYNCSFCAGSISSQPFFFGKNKFLIRKPERVLQDIKILNKKGVKHFIIGGDVTLGGKEFYTYIFENIKKEKLDVSISNMIYHLPSEDFIFQFSNSLDLKNSKLEFSPLSGSEEVRKLNGKNFTNKEFIKTLKIAKENKIFAEIFFQVYLPYEDNASFRKTLSLVREIINIYPKKMYALHCMPVLLDPGSPMQREPEKYKIYHSMKCFKDYYKYSKLENINIWDFNKLGYYPTTKINLLFFQIIWILNKARSLI